MTQYSSNSDFSTDADATTATPDSADGNENNITGWTAHEPADTNGHLRPSEIQENAASEVGGKYCEHRDDGYGDIFGPLQFDEPGTIGTSTEVDWLMRFYVTGTRASDRPSAGCFFYTLGTPDQYYALHFETDNDVRLWYCEDVDLWNPVGAAVAKSVSNDTWYWARVHKTAAGLWSWKLWSGTYSSEGGWDLGDGGSGGTSETSLTSGSTGISLTASALDVWYDYYSVGTAGDDAPGPAGGGAEGGGAYLQFLNRRQ